jgi:hypothetical protein
MSINSIATSISAEVKERVLMSIESSLILSFSNNGRIFIGVFWGTL